MDEISWESLKPYFSCIECAIKDGNTPEATGMLFAVAELLFAAGMALTPDEHESLHKGIDGVLKPYLERVKPYPLHFV